MMRKKLPADRAMGAQISIEKPRWRATALALAAAVLLGVSASDANALGLGRITVQSALGEPLRAQIDVPEINAEEISSLRTAVASPEAFRLSETVPRRNVSPANAISRIVPIKRNDRLNQPVRSPRR
jgi:pilus assembly protein FimV